MTRPAEVLQAGVVLRRNTAFWWLLPGYYRMLFVQGLLLWAFDLEVLYCTGR